MNGPRSVPDPTIGPLSPSRDRVGPLPTSRARASRVSPSRARVGRVGLVLPAAWWVVDLRDDRTRRRSVVRLVAHQVGPQDERATLRAQLRERLEAASREAASAGGRLMAVSLVRARGVPLTVTMTVYRIPGPEGPGGPGGPGGHEGPGGPDGLDEPDRLDAPDGRLADLHAGLVAAPEPGQVLDLAQGIDGPVLRRVCVRTPPADLGTEHIPMLVADYWLDPGDGLMLLTFSSPMQRAREQLLDLFDVIVASVGPEPHP